MEIIQYPVAFIVTLGVLITFHELGHFLIARLSGVHVVRFCVGFGKPVWSRIDRRGTEFAIAAIPLGGYVRMLDERDGVTALPAGVSAVSVNQVSPWWRMAIALGGPIANFILAIIVYWLLFVVGTTSLAPMITTVKAETPAAAAGMTPGLQITAVDTDPTSSWQQIVMALADRLGDTGEVAVTAQRPGDPSTSRVYPLQIDRWHHGVDEPDLLGSLGLEPGWPALVGEVFADGAAAAAGFRRFDEIIAVDEEPVADWNVWVETVRAAPEQSMRVLVRRGDDTVELSLRPAAKAAEDGARIGFVGMAPHVIKVEYPLLGAFGPALTETYDKTLMTLGLLKKMVVGQVSLKNLSGPITIARVAGDSARSSWRTFVGILALLSISLGVLNLLPIPILDGGHVLFCLSEIVTGKPVSERAQLLGTQVGLVIVSGMMLLAIFNDITRFF